jgi:hypothetical protein
LEAAPSRAVSVSLGEIISTSVVGVALLLRVPNGCVLLQHLLLPFGEMSRGLGSVQRHALDYLGRYPHQWIGLREVAVGLWGDVPPTRAQMESVKRSVVRLWEDFGEEVELSEFGGGALETGLDRRQVELPRPFYANRQHLAAKLRG